jgi:hypothetical protein
MLIMNKAEKLIKRIVKGYNSIVQSKGIRLEDFLRQRFNPTDRGIDIICSYINKYYRRVDKSTLIDGDIEERYVFELYRETRKSVVFYTRDKELEPEDVMFHLEFFKEIDELVQEDKSRELALYILKNYVDKVKPEDKDDHVYVFFTGFVKHPWKTDWQVAEEIALEFMEKISVIKEEVNVNVEGDEEVVDPVDERLF